MNGWFVQPMMMTKAGDEKAGRIPVRIEASAPTPDREEELITLKAYDDDTVNEFLRQGIIDYDHKSFLGGTNLEKAQAIIGQPERFEIENKKPVVYGYLFKGNPYVDGSILPALAAGSKVFGASWGGRKLLKAKEFVKEFDRECTVIKKVSLNHLAVCPFHKAVHQGTSVTLQKSLEESSFESYQDFAKSYATGMALAKTLEAGAQTDVAAISGGQALQAQSLEGGVKKLLFDAMASMRKGLVKGYDGLVLHFIKSGVGVGDAERLAKFLAVNSSEIVGKLKKKH